MSYDVLTTVLMNISVFRGVVQCRSVYVPVYMVSWSRSWKSSSSLYVPLQCSSYQL